MALVAHAQLASYNGLTPIAGDAHRHAGSAEAERAFRANPPQCPHEAGDGTTLWQRARANGFDWLSLSYHDTLLTGDRQNPAYLYWTSPDATPRVDPQFG